MSEIWTPEKKVNTQRFFGKGIGVDKQSAATLKLWQHRPKIFFRDVLGVELDIWQEEAMEAYLHNQRVGMIASKGPGKTGMLAFMGWHFFMCFHQPKIAALSISEAHLKSNLWAELLMWRSNSELLKASTNDGATRITLKGHEGYSFIDARAYAKAADESQMNSALAGLHAKNVGFLIDEAGMIPDSVLSTADAALATKEAHDQRARILLTANPEEAKGMLYRASVGDTQQKWAIIRVSGDPDDPKRATRVPISWANEQIATYGRDHPWVMVNVLGQYPPTSSTKLITEQEVRDSMRREIKDDEVKNSQTRLGVDIARGGIDSSAFAKRKGLKGYPIVLMSSAAKGPEVAGKIAFMWEEERIERVYVDDTGGYGSSTMDSLEMFPNIDVTGIKYNGKAQDERHYNKRAEMWIRMRDWIRRGGCLPNDPALAEEILMPNMYFHGGKMRLEEKEQIKARLGRSPDRADSFAQTFADVECDSFYADYESPFHSHTGRPHEMQGRYITEESQVPDNYRGQSNYKS